MGEIDALLDGGGGLEQEDELPEIDAAAAPVTRLGDLWVLGEHRLLCGDALQAESYARVLGVEKADMVFADAPYNLPIDGNVSGWVRLGTPISPWRPASSPQRSSKPS